MSGTKEGVLVVDDDEVFRTRLAQAFRDRGYPTETAGNHATAVAIARVMRPLIAVVDLRMPDASGLDTVRALHALQPTMAILILTGYGSIANAMEAMRLGATSYLSKPADADDILAALARRGSVGDAAAVAPASSGATIEVPSLARVEWEHINRVLTDCAGNLSEAARRLGIHRRSLQRKLRKFPPRR